MKKSPSSISSFRALFLRVGLPLLLLALVALPAIDYWVSHSLILANKKTRTFKLNRLFNELHENEIAMFGSSTVYRGYLPDSLGPQFYNYGMYGSNFQKVKLLLDEELSKPKTTPIILDWHPRYLFFRDSVPIQLEDYLPHTEHQRIQDFLEQYSYAKPWHRIPAVRFYGYFEGYFGAWSRRNHLPKRFGFNRGSKFFKPQTPPDVMQKFVDKRLKLDMTFTFDARLVAQLEGLVAMHPQRPFVFVVSPLHESVQRAGGDLEPVRDYLTRLQGRYPNVFAYVFDGRDYTDDFFLDTMHLNYKGAKRFSAELRDKMRADGLIE